MTTTQRPMRADARRNYGRLLAAARDAFAEHGTEASLEDIARSAEVGIGTLYRHFPTRRALLEAVLHDGIATIDARARELLESPSPEEALLVWLRHLVAHATTYRGLAATLMSSIRDPSSELHGSCETMQRNGDRLLANAQRAGAIRPEVTGADLVKLVNAIAWAGEHGGGDADRLLDLLTDGLRTRDR
ncbi:MULTISPECIES: TetR/AcrR family transcriptional regulator [Streptosporangium]|uniref:AcrR family transcriptional regulator n=1 Tax=Streptosporangium brasiliense TaxID=47480 RepID=A0ABT9RCC0_9ACTN|nr:TetR/AcrR family transcriptional regulator [Streptosporangium brasiliense]MDP9866904.1 AcrR family transcriptional regulator [Streptosporangium brasiliense]